MRNMDDGAFARLARHDSANWWFVAKQRLAVQELRRRGARPPVIDVGCGTGGNLRALGGAGFSPVIGLDVSASALQHARDADAGAPVSLAQAEHLPVASGRAGALVSMDVLEHLDDDVLALQGYRHATQPGATLLVVVPAYQWAWSAKDERLGHRRRYTRPRLRAALEASGLEVDRMTHFHAWLVVPAFLVNRTPLRRLASPSSTEAGKAGGRLNRVLLGVGTVERWWLRHRDLPFGLSIMAVARVPG